MFSRAGATMQSPDHTMLAACASIPKPIGSGDSYFVPMSIGNRYYSRRRMREITSLFLERAESSVVVPCDRLRLFSYSARRSISIDKATQKAKDECDDMIKMLDNVGISRIINCHVIPMSVFYGDPALEVLITKLEKLVVADPRASTRLEELTSFYLDQFYEAADRHEQSWNIQRTNVLHAAGFGIFVTEKLGYQKEIYKEESGLLQTYLYKEHTDLLMELLEKDHLEREFIGRMPLLS